MFSLNPFKKKSSKQLGSIFAVVDKYKEKLKRSFGDQITWKSIFTFEPERNKEELKAVKQALQDVDNP